MKKINLGFVVALSLLLASCGGSYDDFTGNFDYTAVYFGSQKPLRTVVARRNVDEMQIKLGVVLSGLRSNTKGYWADFELAPDLLTSVSGADALTLLPADYYTIECPNNRIYIQKGKLLGDFPIKFNKAKFIADPLAVGTHYALPFRITATSADSLLTGSASVAAKNYTILAIKYIAPEQGTYYVKGSQVELDANGAEVAGTKVEYSRTDLSQNKTRTLTTCSYTTFDMAGLGDKVVSATEHLLITCDGTAASVSQLSASTDAVTDLGSTYSASTTTFDLKYSYLSGGKTYRVEESLILRQDPEKDLRFEEW